MNWGSFFETLGILVGALVFAGVFCGVWFLSAFLTGSVVAGALITMGVTVVGVSLLFGVLDR